MAARFWGIVAELTAQGLVVLGDKGYLGEDCIRTPHRGRNKPASQKEANRAHARRPWGTRQCPAQVLGASCVNSAAALGAPGSWPGVIHVLQTREIERWKTLRACGSYREP
jgi:hypothetical protein